MTNLVEYILSLKNSQFNKGLGDSEGHINKLETSLASVRNAALGFIGAFASVEFLKGSIEMYNESAQASAQLDATLRSTANAANLNRDALDAQADALMKTSLFDDDAITKSQALLATFTNIHDTIYMEAMPAITDMATKMGGDLQGATIQVGKALQDPIQGINALRRVGVNFGEEQKKMIKNMVETNHVAEAQAFILKELQTEFGGSALAASQAGTGPMVVLRNEFNNVREEIGGMVMALVIDLKPALETIVKALSDGVKWVKEHKEGIMAAGKAALVLGGGLFALTQIIIPLGTALSTVTLSAEGFGIAMGAALGPIGLTIAAITTLIGLYGALEQAQADLEKRNAENIQQGNKALLMHDTDTYEKEWKNSKEGLDTFYNKKMALVKSKESEIAEWNRSHDASQWKDYESTTRARAALDELKTRSKTSSAIKAGGGAKPPATDKLEKATGQKAVTINVSINDLIHDFTIQTTNITESAQKVKEMVTNALLDAINNSQMIPIR